MGLDTTHDCWHGPYSQFNRWREHLHVLITNDPLGLDGWDAVCRGKAPNPYEDQSVPINVLMMHSDCDGEIAAEMCGPIADALEALLPKMPERGIYDIAHPATLRFIAGLRRAAAAGEAVEFR